VVPPGRAAPAAVLAAAAAALLAAGLAPALPAAAFTAPQWHATFAAGHTEVTDNATAVSPDGSTVFVTGSTGSVGGISGIGPVIVAYNAATGAELWQMTGTGGGTAPTALAVSPDSSTVYAAINGMSAFDAATGALLWNQPSVSAVAITLSAGASTLYATSGGATEALDAATGAPIWQATESGDRPALDQDHCG
jgi:outer membrane protein assembly factor BamB